ncbi:MAG TPA: SagB family peptide dehydrogenase, partial [Bryobacteraceae bacterium]
EGTDEQQVLRGPAIKNLLPQLVPLLDGTRSMDQLAEDLPQLPPRAIHNAIALLYARGVLEDSAADPASGTDSFEQETLAFFRRYVDATRVNRSGAEAYDRLRNAETAVYAIGRHAEQFSHFLNRALLEAGIRSSHTLSSYAELRRNPALAGNAKKRLLLVLVEGEEDANELKALDEECASLGIPWVRAVIDSQRGIAEIGPYFECGETACYRCFAASRRAANKTSLTGSVEEAEAYLHGRTCVGLLASEAIYILSRIGPMATRGMVTRYDLATWSSQQLGGHRQACCPVCRGRAVAADDTSDNSAVSIVLAYEDAVAFPSRHLLDPKTHQMHYRAANIELANRGKRYPSAERIALPPGDVLPEPDGDSLAQLTMPVKPSHQLTLYRLANLLRLTAGLDRIVTQTKNKTRRWAPTGGNLGSVELYVAAREIEGLPCAIYFYQPHEHLLARVNSVMQAREMEELMRQIAPTSASADALLFFTAAHHRLAQKYGAFAYRLSQLDAGVAQVQARMVASGLGLSAKVVTHWQDEAAMNALDLVPFSEIVTGVMQVNGAELRTE